MLRRIQEIVILSWLVAPGLVAGVGASAWAQDAVPAEAPSVIGVIDAVAYTPIPAGAGFATQSNDNTALTDDALQRVNETLGQKGYRIDNQANLVLSVETQLVRGVAQDTPVGELLANNDVAIVQGKLYSSTQNSLLNPQRPVASGDGIYRIKLAVYDRSNGLYVWRGSINRTDPTVDIGKASAEMVPALLEYLGKTEKPATPNP
jgi:hypothetical protein